MLTILVLFVGLTLATAVIAYWSDNLGKKLGKKRVSLWGMRPRTTATFLTIASSWLIMIFTLGVMLTIFPPLRQSLLRFDEVKAEVGDLSASKTQLTGQVGNLNAKLAALTGQTTSLTQQVAKASGKLASVSGKLKQSVQAAKNARAEQKSAEGIAATARQSASKSRAREKEAVARERAASDNLKKVASQLDSTQQQRAAAQQELNAAQTELKSANAEVKAANVTVKKANERVKSAQDKVKQADDKVSQAQEQLSVVKTDLKTALSNAKIAKVNERTANTNAAAASLNAITSKVTADLAEKRAADANQRTYDAGTKQVEAEGKADKALKTVAELEKQGRDLREANALALTFNRNVSEENDLILASDILVPVGRTLLARTFDEGLSFTQATEDLRALFDRAADEIAPGVLPGARLQLAQRVVPAPNAESGDEKTLVILKEDEIYNELAFAISRSQTPLSVRLVADRNHLEGEKTLNVRFIVVPVRPALAADTELARTTFNQPISDSQRFSALLKLIDAGRKVAAQNGVTPPLSPEAPEFYVPGTNEQIFEALSKISALDDKARVRILTDKPISTADQLSVRFEVTPLSPETAQATVRKSPA